MIKQIRIKEAIGKTIRDFLPTEEYENDEYLITFTDDTFLYLYASVSGYNSVDIDLTDMESPRVEVGNIEILHKMGIISKAEYSEFLAKKEAQSVRVKEQHETYEKQEYLRLKAKYD